MSQLLYCFFRKRNKIMTEEVNSNNIVHLQTLFNQRSPKTKYFSQSRIEQFNDSIVKQIINGDTVISPFQSNPNYKSTKKYEEEQQRLRIIRAEQQKQELQKKLSYLNKSIQSLQKTSSHDLSKSVSKDPQQIQKSRQKQKQLAQSIKLHKQKIQRLRNQQNQRKKKSLEKQTQRIKQLQQEEKQKRKMQILSNLKKIQSNIEQRQIQHQKSTQKIKEIINKKQLYQKMQEQFKQKQSMTLEQRKRKLSEIRNLHRPIDLEQIKEHQKRLEEFRRQKQNLRMQERKINASNIRYEVPYMGSYYKELVEKSSQSYDPLQSSKLKIDKVKQFAEHIRENFAPQIDEKRRQQLQQSIQKQAEARKIKEQKLEEVLQLRKAKGMEYTEYLRKLPKKKNQQKVEDQGSKTARPVYKNYLSHSTNEDSPHKTDQAWNKILTKKELNKKQKARLLQYESEKVEQILKRKEQETRLLKKNNQDDIDQEYYNMIKAKLSLLTSE